MKKVLLLAFVIAIIATSLPTLAQQRRTTTRSTTTRKTYSSNDSENPQNLIKLNILSAFARTGSLSFERVISEKMSTQLGFQYTFPRPARILGQNLIEDGTFNRWAIAPEFRFYPAGNAPTGFYIAPFFRYVNVSLSGRIDARNPLYPSQPNQPERILVDGKATRHTYSLGAVVGGQWVFGEHISLEAFIGPYFSTGSLNVSQNVTDGDINFPVSLNSPVWIRSGMTLGFAF